jgi:PKD repeat protein
VPQPGDTIVDSHYTDPWKSLQAVAGNPFSWYHAGPGGRRDVLLGLGEWATSEDVDTFTVSGGSLANPQTKTGSKYKKAEWFRGALAYFRGEAYTAPHSSANNVTVSTDGPLLIAPIYWNSQALAPRWWNTKPFNTGDTTAPTTSGADAHLSYDAMIDLVNDSIFSTSAVVHTPPVAVLSVTLTDGGTPEDWTFSATAGPGDSAIVSYAYGPGDGSGVVTHTTAALSDSLTHTYAATGSYTVTLTVTDANGLTSVKTRSLVVQPPITGFSGALLIDTGDKVRAFRDTYNPSVLALETYAAVGGATNVVAASGATETLVDPRLSRFQDITLSTNCTITMPTALAGMVAWVLVRQDGGGANTLAWTGVDLWPGGSAPVQTATASHADLYTFVCAVDGEWIGYRSAANLS